MNRKCKRCGRIDFGIWGYVGVIGFSLLVGALGYAIGGSFYDNSLVIVALVFGVILWLPMWFISIHEEKEEKKEIKE